MRKTLTTDCKIFFLLLFAFATFSVASTNVVQSSVDTLLWYLENAHKGDVRISGVLVDDQGDKLDNVNVEISVGSATTGIVQVVTTGSDFSFHWQDCSAVQLEFSKNGYYSEKRSYYIDGAHDGADFVKQFVVATNLTVALQKRGVPMPVCYQEVAHHEADSFRGLYLSPLDPVVVVTNALSLESVNSWIHILCSTNNSGKILLDEEGSPEEVRLVVSGDCIAPSLETGNIPYKALRQMTEAPEVGYAKSLEMRSATITNACFYVRFPMNDAFIYGKGRLSDVYVESRDNRNQVSAYIRLVLQPNGTRNLNAIY